mgnify:CR=1 FL=1
MALTIKIYEVNPQYIDYLIVNGINYFAPLSSFKTTVSLGAEICPLITVSVKGRDIPSVKPMALTIYGT